MERRLVAAWPSPDLTVGEACLPYCDNLTVYGTDRSQVDEGIQKMIRGFRRLGFHLHEISGVQSASQVLGFALTPDRGGRIRPVPRKVWTLREALTWMAAGAFVTGVQVSKLLGLYVSMAILARPALSVPRALYDFVATCEGSPRLLWPSAVYELHVMRGLLPLIAADLARPWAPLVLASDASASGAGVVARTCGVPQNLVRTNHS